MDHFDSCHGFWLRVAAYATVVALLLCLSVRRNELYYTPLSLWKDTVAKSPMKAQAHHCLGNSFILQRRYDEGILEYYNALSIDKNYAETYVALFIYADTMEKDGFTAQAAHCYNIVCNEAPPYLRNMNEVACNNVDRLSDRLAGK